MSNLTEATLLAALKTVVDPLTGKDFVSARQIKNLKIDGDDVGFDVEFGYPAKSQHAALRRQFIAAARGVPGVGNVSVNMLTRITAHAVQRGVMRVSMLTLTLPTPGTPRAAAMNWRRSAACWLLAG